MAYKDYKHLLGLPYIDGDQDCFGLVRRYYLDLYEIEIRNWARPIEAFHSGLDLLNLPDWKQEGFEIVQDSLDRLQVGDLLLINIACPIANHTAVYVGNNYIIHHLEGRKSCEDSFSGAWRKRVMNVVRHPFVTEENNKGQETVDITKLLPEHVKLRYGITKPLG